MAKTKKILKQMMIFSFSAILIMGTGISVSADSSVEENIPDDMIQQIEQCQEETDFFSSNSEVGNFSSGSTDSNDDNNNSGDTITAVIITTIVAIAIITMAMTLTVIIKMTIRMVTVTPVLI